MGARRGKPMRRSKLIPKCETMLAQWLRAHNLSYYSVAKEACLSPWTVRQWAIGAHMPSLIGAFKVEQATKGDVPAFSWVTTERGQKDWEDCRLDWDEWFHQVVKATKKFTSKKKVANAAP